MKEIDDGTFNGRRVKSVIVVGILVASGIFLVFPFNLPTAEATKYHYMGSAALEDQDRGDGFDYNGDIIGDMKVTWHAGADNPHIVNGNFLVEDGYILEIEAGVDVKIDPARTLQIGQLNGATLYCNGTSSSSQVRFIENMSSSPWGMIFIENQAYCHMEYTYVNGGDEIHINNSVLDMNNSEVIDMKIAGIRAIESMIAISNSLIANTMYQWSEGLYCDSTNAIIDNSGVFGYNGSVLENGGRGIYSTGTFSLLVISNSTIMGGKAGESGLGGYAIFINNYDGRIKIVNNHLIQGGKGGMNTFDQGSAGSGGSAIFISPVSNYNSPAAIEIANNTEIKGGGGGDNFASMDGYAGDGGYALRISDDVSKGGEVIIRDNSAIIGGGGGDSNALTSIMGTGAGDGGYGLYIGGCERPGDVLVNNNSDIRGGNGGDNIDGDINSGGNRAGDGNYGIWIYNSNNVTIKDTTVIGGEGGSNGNGNIGPFPGNGGEGIYLQSPLVSPLTNVTIMSSTLTGGNGGTNGVDNHQGAPGSPALFSLRSAGSISSSLLTGGKGGNNSGTSQSAGNGGEGFYASYAFDMKLEKCTINGGRGGVNSGPSSVGGSGGYAVAIIDDSENISLYSNVNIIGGDGGDSSVDTGPGSTALYTILASLVTNISIIGNNITAGKGGRNASGDDWGINNSYCIRCTDISGTNKIDSNNISTRTENFMDSTYGIWLASSSATVSNNEIYRNWRGILVYDTDNVTIGDNNRIFDNFIGITFQDSNGTIGSGNNIKNNDYGIYCNNSNPTIIGDLVIDSNVGIYPDYFSSPKIINCTISSNPGAFDFAVIGDSHPWTLNTSFNKSATIFGDAPSNLTVNWYLHTRVVDKSYLPEENADFWINDTNGKNLYSDQTPTDGWIRWIVVTEYVEDLNGGKYYYTPHDISAAKDTRFGKEIENMDMGKEIIVVLKSKFSMPVKKGWNMISVPLNITDTTLTNVLLDIDGNYKAVQWFNISDQKDPWKHHHIDKGDLNDLTNIENTIGVWIYMKSDDTLEILGFDPDPVYLIELKSGWNFVGYPNLNSRPVGDTPSDAFFSISGFVDMVMHYNASDSSDQWKAWDPGTQSPDDLAVIEPGMGLWIHVIGDCTWVINW